MIFEILPAEISPIAFSVLFNSNLVNSSHQIKEYQDVQVMNFGGNDELPNFLSDLTNMDKFDEVNTIVISRDAETDADAAIMSIQDAIQHANNKNSANIPIPQESFKYTNNQKSSMKVAFMIFPGPEHQNGRLEDLCLSTVENDPLLK
ncbi:hypothetical protein LCGC14_2236250, partial [marine sediment metagenome]